MRPVDPGVTGGTALTVREKQRLAATLAFVHKNYGHMVSSRTTVLLSGVVVSEAAYLAALAMYEWGGGTAQTESTLEDSPDADV